MEPRWNRWNQREKMMAKSVPALSAKTVAAWAAGKDARPELIDGAVPGLRCRRTKGGEVVWSLLVMLAGERRRFPIGAGLGLAEARVKAEQVRRQVKDGVDPVAERKAAELRAKDAREGRGTLRGVISSYYEAGDGRDLKTKGKQQQHLQAVFADLLDRPAMDVSAPDLQTAVVAWSKRAVRSAQLAVGYMRPVVRWAVGLGLMRDGTDGLRQIKRRTAVAQAVLTADEAGRLMKALGTTGFDLAARLMLWTAARRGEVVEAIWSEFDLRAGVWTLPGARRKDTKRRGMGDLVIPLPRQAVALLTTMKGKAEGGGHVVVGARGAELTENWGRWRKRVVKAAGIGFVSPHALRRTAATMMGELGEPPHIVEAALGHAVIGSALAAGYNQSRYTKEVGAALQRLADHLDVLASGMDNNVVRMAKLA